MSRLTSDANTEYGEDKTSTFSYVTGPLEYGRKYAIKLVAINTNGKLGNKSNRKIDRICNLK